MRPNGDRPLVLRRPVPEAKQVGEVGGSVGELQDLEVAVELRELGAQEGLDAPPVEVLAGADRSGVVGQVLGPHGSPPSTRMTAPVV
jgi:hypothetical protein